MKFINGIKMEITLEKDEGGKDLVVILTATSRVALTPHQARLLATKLVMAVSRAEINAEHTHEGNLSPKPAV